MFLWRISRYASLDGVGGTLVSGRWHSAPAAVVYCADHPASALLEVFVHLNLPPDDLPDGYRLLRVLAPDDMAHSAVQVDDLGSGWAEDPARSRSAGDAWLSSGGAALLKAPSAIVQHAWNYIVNVGHEDAARLRIVGEDEVMFDRRLWKQA